MQKEKKYGPDREIITYYSTLVEEGCIICGEKLFKNRDENSKIEEGTITCNACNTKYIMGTSCIVSAIAKAMVNHTKIGVYRGKSQFYKREENDFSFTVGEGDYIPSELPNVLEKSQQ